MMSVIYVVEFMNNNQYYPCAAFPNKEEADDFANKAKEQNQYWICRVTPVPWCPEPISDRS